MKRINIVPLPNSRLEERRTEIQPISTELSENIKKFIESVEDCRDAALNVLLIKDTPKKGDKP